MRKRFNTTGTCIKHKHYMVNIGEKLKAIETMVDRGDYFVINRPRQYGKTTLLSQLSNSINNRYLVIRTSFEGIGDSIFSNEEVFSNKILGIMADSLEFTNEKASEELRNVSKELKNLSEVSKAITKFIKNLGKEVVLLIDEVDKASNNQLFLSFLGMLRSKFLLAAEDLDVTFHSVILAGVHDVKNLKLKFRGEDDKKLNSPWNIAVNFNIDMSFNSEEIETMLKEYAKINELLMDTKALSNLLYYYTSGYPFLVSRLCQIVDENIVGEKKIPWTLEYIEEAVKEILKESNTLFDDLIKNIENNKEIYNLVERLILLGDEIAFTISEIIISLGTTYGIIKEHHGKCKINNKLFELYIYNHMTVKVIRENESINRYNYRENFIKENNELDFNKVLLKFQQFMKEQYSSIDMRFIEREGRLLFLAFIKPIINGVGFDFKEVQISEEKRLDVVITYLKKKYVVELKIWHGEEYHLKGIKQLSNYLDIQGLNKGYLVVYNFNKNKQFNCEEISFEGKEIFIVYV